MGRGGAFKWAVKVLEGTVGRIVKLLLPFVLAAAYIIFLYGFLDRNDFNVVMMAMGGYFFPPLGKESVIPLAVSQGVDWIVASVSVAMVDILIALFMLWNFDLFLKIPMFGAGLEKFVEKGMYFFSKHKWADRLSLLGIMVFVMIPFEGSGGIVASAIGRILGVNKYKVFTGITIGSLLGCLMIGYFSDRLLFIFSMESRTIIIIILAIALLVLVYRIDKTKIIEKTKYEGRRIKEGGRRALEKGKEELRKGKELLHGDRRRRK